MGGCKKKKRDAIGKLETETLTNGQKSVKLTRLRGFFPGAAFRTDNVREITIVEQCYSGCIQAHSGVVLFSSALSFPCTGGGRGDGGVSSASDSTTYNFASIYCSCREDVPSATYSKNATEKGFSGRKNTQTDRKGGLEKRKDRPGSPVPN